MLDEGPALEGKGAVAAEVDSAMFLVKRFGLYVNS